MRPIRRRTWEVLDAGVEGDDLSHAIDVMIMGLVIVNVLAVILESVESIGYAYQDLFAAVERVSIVAFTAEFLARLWSAADSETGEATDRPFVLRLRYLRSPMAIVDVLAIAPFYLGAILPLDFRALRVLRLLRIVKLTRYSPALLRIVEVWQMQRPALAASFFVMSVAIVFSASVVYLVESAAQPEAFGSIPAAMWWAVCTLTTVGYGDVAPITPLGKVLASGIQIVGIGMVALPTSLLASGFAHIMQRNEAKLRNEARDFAADGIITSDEANAYADLAEQLHVEPEIAEQIIRAAQNRQNLADQPGCPHCGKPLA